MARYYCPGGQWTTVAVLGGPFPYTCTVTCPVRASWRKYGIGAFLPYEQGTFPNGTVIFWHSPFDTIWIQVLPVAGTYVDVSNPYG
jgi:hypothetical protein